MKTIKLLIPALLMVVFVQNSFAKQKIGLYLTAEDFSNHKLSYESDGSNGNKILLHAIFGGYKVVVVQNGKKHFFSKNEIYGYRLNDQDYRYFNNSAYRIIDTKGFYIYGYCKLIPAGKGLKQSESFYFSSKTDDDIKPLTMDNLQAAFSKNTRFLYTIQGFFKTDNELTSYDTSLKEYKLKYLYAQTSR
ncbi:MAG TPA: hypothetical protein VK671_13720 [Mucilaginibacter sp.]|jgi:hypothetical protein|nr:hypothetical protein [Mucilaginibacter sp.]